MGRKIVGLVIAIVVIGAGIVGAFTFGHSIITSITKSANPNTSTTTNGRNPTYVHSLSLFSVQLVSGTNASMVVTNSGNGSATLTSYYVLDASGDQYARTSWSGPTINAYADGPSMAVLIGPSCPNCTLTGNAFQFANLTNYTVKFTDSKGTLWSFPFFYVPNSG
jgi:hypothetical protein